MSLRPSFIPPDGPAAWWWTTALVLAALFLATVVLALFDRRLIDGGSIWAKPLKFQASLALHFATLALATACLGEPFRSSAAIKAVALTAIAATAFEIAYIMMQAGLQQASHFNLSSPFHSFMYGLMAFGAVVIVAAAGVIGVAALADGGSRLGLASRWAIGLGFIGGTILTIVIAFRMGGALTHHVGIEPQGAPRFPLTGWSLTVGDRRVPHFFATHMIQAVPLAGLLASAAFPPALALGAVILAAIAWIALTLALFQQANAGLPFTHWFS